MVWWYRMHYPFEAFHNTESYFFSSMSAKKLNCNTLIAYATGVAASSLNPAIIKQRDNTILQDIQACSAFYEKQNLPWALVLPEYLYDESINQMILDQNLCLTDKGVAMSILLNTVKTPLPSSHLIIKMMNNDLSTWSIPLLLGFESTQEIIGVYTKQHQLALDAGTTLYHLSGFIDDQIICSLTLSLTDDHARIDDVSTLPTHQKNGYATALMKEAVNYAKQLKARTCFLEASDAGLSIYQQIGFSELFKNCYYEIQG